MSQFKKDIIICTKITRLQYNLLTNYLINSNGEEGEGGGGEEEEEEETSIMH